jgi:hypothetical protein
MASARNIFKAFHRSQKLFLKAKTTLCTLYSFRSAISLGYIVGGTRSAVTHVNVGWQKNTFFYDIHHANLQQIK